MNVLKTLVQLSETSDLSRLPDDAIKDIEKNIRDGAKDLDQLWANALELVHKAYEVAGVQRPNPDMREGWKQYEANIEYSVQQLAKYRGMDGDWRMSAAVFRESKETETLCLHALREAMTPKKTKFRVEHLGDTFGEANTVGAKSIDDILDQLKQQNTDLYDMEVNKSDDGRSASIGFSKWGIKKNYRININQIF